MYPGSRRPRNHAQYPGSRFRGGGSGHPRNAPGPRRRGDARYGKAQFASVPVGVVPAAGVLPANTYFRDVPTPG